ncbi:MAG: tetratricopeptide repeat protein [Bacteroidaceae bacterium]|nr:tetratricopeptide repeat protein [Bacteroidaceae bacterium]
MSLLLMAVCAQAQTPQQWRDSVTTLMEQIRMNPDNIDLRLKKAEANINLQQYDYAISEYGDVLRLDEKNLAALYFRAYCHSQKQRYDLAKVDYETFILIDPLQLNAHLGLAHTLQKMGRKADTVDQLNRCVQLFPDSADAYAARAAYETEQQLYDVALYDWDEAFRLNPRKVEYAVSKVDVLLRQRRILDARLALDELVRKGTPRAALKEWFDRCR